MRWTHPLPTHTQACSHLSLSAVSDLDSIIERRTKTLIMSYRPTHADEHFIHDFLEQLPSGRYRTLEVL